MSDETEPKPEDYPDSILAWWSSENGWANGENDEVETFATRAAAEWRFDNDPARFAVGAWQLIDVGIPSPAYERERESRQAAERRAEAAERALVGKHKALEKMWDAFHNRRAALIGQDELTTAEESELAEMQAITDEYLDATSPIQLDDLDWLEKRVQQLRKAEREGATPLADAATAKGSLRAGDVVQARWWSGRPYFLWILTHKDFDGCGELRHPWSLAKDLTRVGRVPRMPDGTPVADLADAVRVEGGDA